MASDRNSQDSQVDITSRRPARIAVTLLLVALMGFLVEMLVMKGLEYLGPKLHTQTGHMLDAIIVALVVGPIAAVLVMVRHPSHSTGSDALLSGQSGRALAVGVLILGMIASSAAAYIAGRQIDAADEVRFHRLSDRLSSELTRRFALFEYGLQGARGLWRASKSVERGEFVEWVRSRDLEREFFGATGMGFIRKVPLAEVDEFLIRTRQDGAPNFALNPETSPGNATDRYIIEYIEPVTANLAAQGFDIASENVRRDAADLAAATARPTITAPITLVQAPDEGSGFLYLHTVYRNGVPLATPEQRVQATIGWVFFPVVVSRVLRGATDVVDVELDFEVFDSMTKSESRLIFDADGHLPKSSNAISKEMYQGRRFSRFDNVTIGQREWALVTSSSSKFVYGSRAVVWSIFYGGTLVTLLASGLIYALGGTAARARGLAQQKTMEIIRTTAALTKSEAALRSTSRLAQVGWWELDVATMQLHWSDETRNIHRVPLSYQPTLESAVEFYAPEARQRIGKAVQDAIEHRRTFNLELPLIAADGARLWVRAQGEPVTEDGRVISLFGAFQDVTDQVVSRQRAEDSSRSKSEFLANMSHEIRTPMTAILGFTDLLSEDGDIARAPERRQDAIHTIRRNGQHLLSIINDILDVSKIEAGKMTVEHIPTEIHRIIEDVLSLMRVRTQPKGVQLSVVYATEIPRQFHSDPVRVKQILVNLVGNAVKFTEQGSVTIRVSFDPIGPHGGHLTVAVQDTGVGMSQAQIERIFRPFSQADETVTRTFGGTGLGLTIARRLAELLGGDIAVQSEPGKGSSFTLVLPTGHVPVGETWNPVGAPASVAPAVPVPASTALPSLRGVRVLLAEDGEDNQRLISFFLTRAGATIKVVENGKRALEALGTQVNGGYVLHAPPPFDVILMDMQMPEMDGYSATRRLRTLGCTLPVIALTAHAMAGDREICLDAGCDDYATKPIDRTILINMCARWAAAQARGADERGAASGSQIRR